MLSSLPHDTNPLLCANWPHFQITLGSIQLNHNDFLTSQW